jgi:hypothetical protein
MGVMEMVMLFFVIVAAILTALILFQYPRQVIQAVFVVSRLVVVGTIFGGLAVTFYLMYIDPSGKSPYANQIAIAAFVLSFIAIGIFVFWVTRESA